MTQSLRGRRDLLSAAVVAAVAPTKRALAPVFRANLPEWLAVLHRAEVPVFLDVATFALDFGHQRRAATFLEACTADSRTGAAVLGIHAVGIAYVLPEALWQRWSLHRELGVDEEAVSEVLMTRDRLAREAKSSGGALQWLACQHSLQRRWERHEAARPAASRLSPEQVREAVIPAATLVPAVVHASAIAQLNGVPYVVSA